jgi:hypothetical protein
MRDGARANAMSGSRIVKASTTRRRDGFTPPRFSCKRRSVKIEDLTLRNAQDFGEGFLIDRRWKIEKDRRKRDRIARETAMNALRWRPLQIAGLALKTYMGYWGIASIQSYAREDLGVGELTDEQVKMLLEKSDLRRSNRCQRSLSRCYNGTFLVVGRITSS